MKLAYNLQFDDLYTRNGLKKIDSAFINFLESNNVAAHNDFIELRSNPNEFPKKEISNILIDVAREVEDFTAELFNIRKEVAALQAKHLELAPIYAAKKLFVQRQMKKYLSKLNTHPALDAGCDELELAKKILKWMDDGDEENLIAAAHFLNENADDFKTLTSLPKKIEFENLVPLETEIIDGISVLKKPQNEIRARDGFKLTDDGGDLKSTLVEANYCIYCHNQGKDSCSKGLWEKEERKPKMSEGNVPLAGCPLEEKISEMNQLKAEGFSIGALGMITIDNPMAAATGHRICNDCMKSCIYQKQDPVNIPQVETRTLRDVLNLPYGFEIYSLFTRWNPLNLDRPIPKENTNKKIMVVGMGPAGFTLAHHLMNDGHEVTGIDGLKIEPLPKQILSEPIKNISEIWEELNERILAGFGGVAEYGITVRWDKNFLKIIRLLLERRNQFELIGGVRFGSNITTDQAYEMGFDHIAMCAGAGKPTLVNMKNNLARGVRTASDFLMSLQLTGAAKKDSIANLTLRQPIVVIGGGLTAIDTATEAGAYYKIQCEKFKQRYEILCQEIGEKEVRANWSEEENIIADEFLRSSFINHPSSIIYRRRLQDSPAYRLNHEEVEKAFEEGINFIEKATPTEVVLDKFGHAEAIKIIIDGVEKTIPAKTILIAAGTSPNTVLAREDGRFELDGKYFQKFDLDGNKIDPEYIAKPSGPNILMHAEPDGKSMSFFGDLHPDFAGNVVKAMASAKQGYPIISKILENRESRVESREKVKPQLTATVHQVNRLAPKIVEVILHSPQAAKNFQPGQFFRLQNYETNALNSADTTLSTEGLAMTGAWVDVDAGLVSTIILEMGGSSDLCAYFKPGEEVILMGPTGTPTEIPKSENVILCGGGLGNAVLFSIGKAMRENGCKITYFAGYKKEQDRYKIEEIEKAADIIVWCCEEKILPKTRDQDFSFKGNIVEAMQEYTNPQSPIPNPQLKDATRLLVIGSDKMMAAIAHARHNQLKEFLPNCKLAIASINSPMQCMMKEICAQCLQRHVDPETGEESFVYSCFNQDQCLDKVDFDFLTTRLKQNSVQEKLTAKWIDYCLKELELRSSATNA